MECEVTGFASAKSGFLSGKPEAVYSSFSSAQIQYIYLDDANKLTKTIYDNSAVSEAESLGLIEIKPNVS